MTGGRIAIQRMVDGQPHALVMPGRLGVPLIGELDPHGRRMPRGHEREARVACHVLGVGAIQEEGLSHPPPGATGRDRKSTRLNSSHLVISYAVFCLKKKKHEVECSC